MIGQGKVREVNVVISGVGGQGTLVMIDILGRAALMEGLKIRGSELMAMAQRGGDITTYIRFGDEVYSTTVPEGKADIFIALEPAESLRNIKFISKKTFVIISNRPIIPPVATLGLTKYPQIEEILRKIREVSPRMLVLNPYDLAVKAGDAIAANMVMLGSLAGTGILPIKVESLKQAIKERFRGKMVEINLKALELGYNYVKKHLKES